MNEYIIPIYNKNREKVYLKKYIARSLNDCMDKIMEDFDYYDSDWSEFKNELSDEYVFGNIVDKDEL